MCQNAPTRLHVNSTVKCRAIKAKLTSLNEKDSRIVDILDDKLYSYVYSIGEREK